MPHFAKCVPFGFFGLTWRKPEGALLSEFTNVNAFFFFNHKVLFVILADWGIDKNILAYQIQGPPWLNYIHQFPHPTVLIWYNIHFSSNLICGIIIKPDKFSSAWLLEKDLELIQKSHLNFEFFLYTNKNKIISSNICS